MRCVVGTRIRHIVEDIIPVEAIPIASRTITVALPNIAKCIIQWQAIVAVLFLSRDKLKRTSRTCLSAICVKRSGLKVPSVSMYMALPSPPPFATGSCTSQHVSAWPLHG